MGLQLFLTFLILFINSQTLHSTKDDTFDESSEPPVHNETVTLPEIITKTESSEKIAHNPDSILSSDSGTDSDDLGTISGNTATLSGNSNNPDPVVSNGIKVLVVSLGGGDDEIFMSHVAKLLITHEFEVTALLYGNQREVQFYQGIKILQIPEDLSDPLRSGGKILGITSSESSKGEWAAGRIVQSRICACRNLVHIEDKMKEQKPSLIISPLFLHDVCILALANRLDVPVVGVLTSRIGAWWAWAQLGVLPPLSIAPVPLTSLGDGGFWSRASNLASHYSYMSSLRQQWQVLSMSSLPETWRSKPLHELYEGVSRLLIAWDPLVDPGVDPVQSVIPVGSFSVHEEGNAIQKDLLVPALINRAGIVVVSAGSLEAWVGEHQLQLIYDVLQSTSYTVLWKTSHEHLKPNITERKDDSEHPRTRFIFKKDIPLNGVLGHSRHRFLISTCGEIELMSSVHFGSPVLCIPITTDQTVAAMQLEKMGSCIVLPSAELTRETLTTAIEKISSERRYRLLARALAESLHDQPLSPSERLLFHVANAARRPKDVRYRVYGSRLPLFQRTNADVFLAIIILVVCLLTLLIYALLKLQPLLSKLKIKSD